MGDVVKYSVSKLEYIIFNLFILSIFSIYIPLLPLSSETQPILPLLFSLIIILLNIRKVNLYIKYDVALVYLLIGIISIYFFTSLLKIGYSEHPFINYIKYLIGPFIYLAIRNNIDDISFKNVRNIILFLFIVSILVHFKLFQNIHSLIIKRSQTSFAGHRINILTNEPSYFAFFFVLLLGLLDYISIRTTTSKKIINILKLLLFIMAFSTESGLVFLLILIYIFSFFLVSRFNIKILIIILGIISFFFIIKFSNNRISKILLIVKQFSHFNVSFKSLFFNIEPSGGTRVLLNYIAFKNMFHYPLGTGLGSFYHTISNTKNIFGVAIKKQEVLRLMPHTAQTYVMNLFNDIGIFAFILPIILLVNNVKPIIKKWKLLYNFIFLSLIVMFFFQCQITNPIPWVLMALLKTKWEKKYE